MTIKENYKKFLTALDGINDKGEAAAISNIIFEYFTKFTKSKIITDGNIVTNAATEIKLHEVLQKLIKGVPVQYVTGQAWFYNVLFSVNDHVLIPRPETEELVQEAIEFLKKSTFKKVLDVGTGSGCIPIAIKKNVYDAIITSIDVSAGALYIARENAVANNTAIHFIEIDFLQENNWNQLKKYDLIISNPPYIPENEKKFLDKNVAHYEPHLALFVPQNDPLLFYRKILLFADEHLEKNGKIFLETHEDLAKETAALFLNKNYKASIKKDMFEKERMVIVNR